MRHVMNSLKTFASETKTIVSSFTKSLVLVFVPRELKGLNLRLKTAIQSLFAAANKWIKTIVYRIMKFNGIFQDEFYKCTSEAIHCSFQLHIWSYLQLFRLQYVFFDVWTNCDHLWLNMGIYYRVLENLLGVQPRGGFEILLVNKNGENKSDIWMVSHGECIEKLDGIFFVSWDFLRHYQKRPNLGRYLGHQVH